ncbi:MAG: OmpA family protein [Flavobacteriaceae bacterium]
MMRAKYISPIVLFFVLGLVKGFGQGNKSLGNSYFFQYRYDKAIVAYEEELLEGALTEQGQLNLADSYFATKDFKKAFDAYFELFKKDTLLKAQQLNKMLRSLSRTSNEDKKNTFLETMSGKFEKELIENFKFNRQLLNDTVIDGGDFQIFNLNANSPQSDFSPSFYKGNLLFSSGRTMDKKSQYLPAGEGYLNIYESTMESNGQLVTAEPFMEIPKSKYHKATPFYSGKLESLFYVLSNTQNGELAFDPSGKNALAIGMQKFGGPFRLLLKDLSTSFYYPFYHEENDRLYFSANFEDGYGGTDIYMVYTNNGQIMSAPINLGPSINSPGNEIAPFIFEDNFYFSSDVFYGLGGMDIYKSNIEGDAFSIPVNLGKGINSSSDDFGLIIKNKGEGLLGYFASNRIGGKGKDDLYGFRVDKKPGLKTLILKGKVVKSYQKSIVVPNTVVSFLDVDGNRLAETQSDDEGNYRLEIPWKKEVVLEANKERFSMFAKRFDEESLALLIDGKYDIEVFAYDDLVEKKENQTVVKLNKFYFGRGQSKLTPEIADEMDKVVAFVKHFPSSQLRIETHTDSRGGGSTNFRLTQTRSDALKNYLTENGVSSSNILYSVGYGEDKILNNCKNGVYCLEMLHQQNQRSLIVILNDNLLFE